MPSQFLLNFNLGSIIISSYEEALVQAALQEITQNYREASLSNVARTYGVSLAYVSECVRTQTDKTGFAAPEVAFVGDRLYTDVATGVKNGAVGLLVLTGETHLEDVPTSEVQPDAIFASLGEMGQQLCQL